MYSEKGKNNSWMLLIPIPILLTLLFFIISFIYGCSNDDKSMNATAQGTNEIFIQGMAFSPTSKTITVGTIIKWTNKDGATHTVTSGIPGSPSGLFDSGNLGSNGVFSYTFSQTGIFKYYCNIHSSMTGTITVQ